MSILYNEEKKTITLYTKNTSYQMRITPHGFLQHLYYGKRIESEDMSYLFHDYDRPCSGNPEETYPDRTISLDTMTQEYPG